jgi:hypothetical protein
LRSWVIFSADWKGGPNLTPCIKPLLPQPRKKGSKLLAIAIAFVGIIFSGIMVAIALHAAAHAFKATHDVSRIIQQMGG